MIRDYHLQRGDFQETNWRIQSINRGDMDNMSFHQCWDSFHGTQSIYISTSKSTIINRHTLPVLMLIWNGLRITNGSAGCAHLDV